MNLNIFFIKKKEEEDIISGPTNPTSHTCWWIHMIFCFNPTTTLHNGHSILSSALFDLEPGPNIILRLVLGYLHGQIYTTISISVLCFVLSFYFYFKNLVILELISCFSDARFFFLYF